MRQVMSEQVVLPKLKQQIEQVFLEIEHSTN